MTGSRVVHWAVRVLGVALVVALAALLALRVYGAARFAAAEKQFAEKVGHAETGTSTPVQFLDEENAALFLRAGAEAMILPGNDKPLVGGLTMAAAESWSDGQRADLRHILANNRPALELLHRAGGMTKSNFGAIGSANKAEELTMGHLLKLMWAQRLLFVDARVALLEHDSERLLADAASMATMAAGLERETPRVELLVGVACEKILLAAVGEAVADPSLERETLTRLQGMLVDTDLRAAWRRSILAEQAEIREHVAAVMSDPLTARQEKVGLWGRFMEFAFGKVFQAHQLELRADLISAVDQPLGLDPPWFGRGMYKPHTMFRVFESLTFPESAKTAGRLQSTLSVRNVARIALGIRLQGSAAGSYPATLAGVPGGTERDPFAGKPLTYERRPDGSAHISVPDFGALWKRISDASPSSQPFSWELPAPRPATASDAAR